MLAVLALLNLLVDRGTDLEIGLGEVNPVLLGYGALFITGIVAGELLRPILSQMAPVLRFVVVAVLAGMVWVGFEQARNSGGEWAKLGGRCVRLMLLERGGTHHGIENYNRDDV